MQREFARNRQQTGLKYNTIKVLEPFFLKYLRGHDRLDIVQPNF